MYVHLYAYICHSNNSSITNLYISLIKILDHIKTLVNIHDVTVDGSGSTPLETSLEAQADMEAICSVFKIDKKKGIDSSSLLSQIINGQALKGYN